MIVAIVLAVIVMMISSGAISRFIEHHPTIKMLGELFDLHIPKGYVYFAMAFSLFVEMLNTRVVKGRARPVHFRKMRIPGEHYENS